MAESPTDFKSQPHEHRLHLKALDCACAPISPILTYLLLQARTTKPKAKAAPAGPKKAPAPAAKKRAKAKVGGKVWGGRWEGPLGFGSAKGQGKPWCIVRPDKITSLPFCPDLLPWPSFSFGTAKLTLIPNVLPSLTLFGPASLILLSPPLLFNVYLQAPAPLPSRALPSRASRPTTGALADMDTDEEGSA